MLLTHVKRYRLTPVGWPAESASQKIKEVEHACCDRGSRPEIVRQQKVYEFVGQRRQRLCKGLRRHAVGNNSR